MAAGTAFAQQPPAMPPTAQPPVEQPQPMRQTDPTQPQTPPRTDVGQPPGMEPREHGMDKNPSYGELNARGDGCVTRADLTAHPRLLEKFDDIDTAGDGAISGAEYDAWMSKKKEKKDRGDDASRYGLQSLISAGRNMQATTSRARNARKGAFRVCGYATRHPQRHVLHSPGLAARCHWPVFAAGRITHP